MALPTLVVVSGPGGSGKTTLAHRIARSLGCPAVCRDEIKEGMVHANPGFQPTPGDPLTRRTLTTFFEVVELLLRAGVTTVSEAAFQDRLWRPGLEPLVELADIRIVRCSIEPALADERMRHRLTTNPLRASAHADADALGAEWLTGQPFADISLDLPTLTVDTTDGYRPGLDAILSFLTADQP